MVETVLYKGVLDILLEPDTIFKNSRLPFALQMHACFFLTEHSISLLYFSILRDCHLMRKSDITSKCYF